MRIVFIGNVVFSASFLKKVLALNAEVVGICSNSFSSFNHDHFDLRSIADDAHIPYLSVKNINETDVYEWIEEKEPDVIFCFGWSRLLGKEIIQLPKIGAIGFHPASLPQNRGRHPLIWALALGLKKTASTFFFLDEGVDTGSILSQAEIEITNEDDAATLYSKVTLVGEQQIAEFLPALAKGTFTCNKQKFADGNSWRKRGLLDGQIDWRMSAESINNLVRALTRPYVGAHFVYLGNYIKVWKSEVVENVADNLEPGKILENNASGLLIKAGSGALRLQSIDPIICPKVGEYL